MKKPPAFQFYADAWLSSTAHMTLSERGAYITLLAWSWDNGPLPAGLAAMARIVGIHPRIYGRLWHSLLSTKFALTTGGYINVRLEEQRTELNAFIQKQTARGQKGAEARWHGTGNAQALLKHRTSNSQTMALQSPSKIQDQDPRFAPNAQVRKQVRAALHQQLDNEPETPDSELAAVVKDLGRPLRFTWNIPSEITALIESVRGERATRERKRQ